MCGIVGYSGKPDPKDVILDGLKRLEYRGYDSAGISILENGRMKVYRAEGRISNLESKLANVHFTGSLGMGHTRWATHGAPTEHNAHPHQIGKVTLVHNGIIENYLEKKAEIVNLGREILSDTDSEIVAHLIDIQIESGKSLSDSVFAVLPSLRGSYAFVIASESEPDVLIGVCNGAPLLVGAGSGEVFLASDVQAVLSHTNKIIYLRDHQVALCKGGEFSITDSEGAPIAYDIKTINWSADQLDKQGYDHYMLKEIYEQPRALVNTIEGNINPETGIIQLEELLLSSERLKKTERVLIIACGTARHAALVGKYLVEQFARIPVEVDFASEFRYRNPVLDSGALCIFVSQSGETADTLGALREAKRRGCFTVSICNVRESSIARDADCALYTSAGPEIGVASTKAFTTQMAVLYMFAVQLGHVRSAITKDDALELTRDLVRLPVLMESALTLETSVKEMVKELRNLKLFLFLGRGILNPIASEGALKLKEISYLHAEGYPAGELKHGPIALVEKDLVTVVVCPRVEKQPPPLSATANAMADANLLYEKTIGNIQEVKSRGGRIVTFGTKGDTVLPTQSFYFGAIPETTWGLSPILMSVPMQFFAYHLALMMGTDIDKPRNLAKSVTVE